MIRRGAWRSIMRFPNRNVYGRLRRALQEIEQYRCQLELLAVENMALRAGLRQAQGLNKMLSQAMTEWYNAYIDKSPSKRRFRPRVGVSLFTKRLVRPKNVRDN